MASPQPDRTTRIAHELLEAVYRFPFTAAQLRLLLGFMRLSYGWNRKTTEPMGYKKIARELDLPRTSVRRACDELMGLNVIIQTSEGSWGIQKDYDAWTRESQAALPLESIAQGGRGRPPGGPLVDKKGAVGGPRGGRGWPAYKEITNLEKERKEASPFLLPNGKTDTLRHRAELGHPEFPLEDHADFKRLDFGLQKDLVSEWKEAKKKNACSKCGREPKAAAGWAFCRNCTKCIKCGAKADGKTKFKARGDEIRCASHVDKSEA